MTTSEHSTAQNIQEKSTYSRGASLASLFPLQDNEEERQTTVISGQKCYELYGIFDQRGWLLKTFVASLLGATDWYSRACVLTWKLMATKSKRYVFQLAPSVRRTNGKESGLLLTPRATEHEENHARFVERNGDRTMNAFPTLSNQIKAMLPTPSSRDWKGKRNGKRRGFGGDVNDALALLPTPRANKIGGYASPDFSPTLEQKVGMKLQPAFAAWMMGYPENWTESPFQNGEKNPSKPTATP